MPIFRGAGGAGDATNDATVTAVQAAATSAATSATNAANSATAAANSASGAATSATNASNSATTAAGQATTAAGHASSASTFATNSSLSADDSADSATEAEGYASEAFDYKVEASVSAGAASDSEDAAAASAALAEGAVDDALALYGDAAALDAAVTAAQLAETNAETAETNAETAATTATNAASTATTQATNAAASASAANADATAASIDANEAQAAAIAAQSAVNNAEAIYGSLEDIQQAEANSEANRDAAAASATSASNSASTATTQAGIATTQATSASASAAAASAVALGNEPVRHSVRPSLLLDFANTKTLDPRITFTRASTGTFYDGKTVAKAEENLLLQTVDMGGVFYTSSATGTASVPTKTSNYGVAPDGTTTAGRYQLNLNGGTSVNDIARVLQGYNFGVAVTATYSVYIKSTDGTSTYAAQIISSDALGQAITITGAWTRFTVTATSLTSSVSYGIRLRGGQTPTNSDTADILVWGAQLEQRSSVTAYTATTTAPITNYIPALQSAASGVARFEHNPTTGESLGLEIEEQRTNLVVRSQEFQTTWATTNASITTDTIITPDGTLTGDKLVEDTTNGQHRVGQAVTVLASTTYTASFYAKAGERTLVQWFDNAAAGNTAVIFNLSAGTIASEYSAGVSTISAVGNGWYRCSVRTTTGAAQTTLTPVLRLVSTGTTTSYAGDGYSGLYLWGAQLEAGSFATSYIPTVASQVTRSADSAVMTGTNFSSWYRTDEGTVYSEASTLVAAGNSRTAWALGFTSSSNDSTSLTSPYTGTGRYRLLGFVGSTANIDLYPATTFTSGSINKAGFAYAANDFALSVNSGTVTTDTSGYMSPAIDRFSIGTLTTGSNPLSGTIKKLAYYPKRLTNAELQGLTTV